MNEEKKSTRREVVKKLGKTSLFVLPLVSTFKVSQCQVRPSGPIPGTPV